MCAIQVNCFMQLSWNCSWTIMWFIPLKFNLSNLYDPQYKTYNGNHDELFKSYLHVSHEWSLEEVTYMSPVNVTYMSPMNDPWKRWLICLPWMWLTCLPWVIPGSREEHGVSVIYVLLPTQFPPIHTLTLSFQHPFLLLHALISWYSCPLVLYKRLEWF